MIIHLRYYLASFWCLKHCPAMNGRRSPKARNSDAGCIPLFTQIDTMLCSCHPWTAPPPLMFVRTTIHPLTQFKLKQFRLFSSFIRLLASSSVSVFSGLYSTTHLFFSLPLRFDLKHCALRWLWIPRFMALFWIIFRWQPFLLLFDSPSFESSVIDSSSLALSVDSAGGITTTGASTQKWRASQQDAHIFPGRLVGIFKKSINFHGRTGWASCS